MSFETAIPAIEGPKTYALNRTATGVEKGHNSLLKIPMSVQKEVIGYYLRFGHMLSKASPGAGCYITFQVNSIVGVSCKDICNVYDISVFRDLR